MDYIKNGISKYFVKNKVAVIFLTVCLVAILISSLIDSAIQTDG